MSKLTLDEMLKSQVLDLSFTLNGIKTTIHADNTPGNVHRSISVENIVLDYNVKRFEDDPQGYLSEQLDAHRKYVLAIQAKLNAEYTTVNKGIENEIDLNRKLQFLPETKHQLVYKIARWFLTPLCWLMGTTLQKMAEEAIVSEKQIKLGYSLVQLAVIYGNILFNDLKLRNPEVSEDTGTRDAIDECISQTKNLQLLYSRLMGTSDKKIAYNERLYQLIFPENQPKIDSI